jgi:TrpR-related protein YerC/YecD
MKPERTDRRALETELYEAILSLKNEQECRDFFADLCTPAEIQDMGDRWRVAQMLARNEPYRAIAAETGVSVTTVTRVARFLFGDNEGYKRILQRMEKK